MDFSINELDQIDDYKDLVIKYPKNENDLQKCEYIIIRQFLFKNGKTKKKPVAIYRFTEKVLKDPETMLKTGEMFCIASNILKRIINGTHESMKKCECVFDSQNYVSPSYRFNAHELNDETEND